MTNPNWLLILFLIPIAILLYAIGEQNEEAKSQCTQSVDVCEFYIR